MKIEFKYSYKLCIKYCSWGKKLQMWWWCKFWSYFWQI